VQCGLCGLSRGPLSGPAAGAGCFGRDLGHQKVGDRVECWANPTPSPAPLRSGSSRPIGCASRGPLWSVRRFVRPWMPCFFGVCCGLSSPRMLFLREAPFIRRQAPSRVAGGPCSSPPERWAGVCYEQGSFELLQGCADSVTSCRPLVWAGAGVLRTTLRGTAGTPLAPPLIVHGMGAEKEPQSAR
jgi:hypothetical protein